MAVERIPGLLKTLTPMEKVLRKLARNNVLHGDNVGLTPDLMAPWDPYFLEPPAKSNLDSDSYRKSISEWMNKKEALLCAYGNTAIMYPDITPKAINNNFYTTMNVLLPILEKDSPRRFLSFFDRYGGWIVWRSIIIPEALNCLITENAVKCANVVLEGKAPELNGLRANPNWMSQYGHFPLHQATDIFAVDMIKLLLSKGASANVRTAGNRVIEGLLPLHVAVENTCMHKYLEDNLLPNWEHPSYSKADVYRLIYLLCLPEMKVFLDASRELAKHTNGVVDEIWTYIKDGKLVHAGVLLLTAQEHIRLEPSCKKNDNSRPDGFAIILSRIANHLYSFGVGMVEKEREPEQPHVNIKYLSSALLLVNVISQAGKALHEYILVHSEVPHEVVLERVSSILKDFGFCPPEEAINIGNLCPYKCLHYEEILGPPNRMNQYGCFPLHEAAETFSVDMIKLLIHKGVSANARVTGNTVNVGLLPLHVAVKNTCLQKYLEDNLLPNREHPSYSKAEIYKLIHLLCLPEMKIFLDTTRELAKHTSDLVDEVWNYIKDGKLVHAGVLLLAAQEHIRLGSSSKKNGNSKPDGFATIVNRIADNFYTFDLEMVQNKKELEQPHANIKYLSTALLLVNAISQAGKTLHEYIRVHSEVSHLNVLERVSWILKDFGFYSTEEGFDIGNLCLPYEQLPDKQGRMVPIPTKKDTETPCLQAAGRKMTKKMLARYELGYKKAQFFPYWRSVLSSMSPVKLFPSHAVGEALSLTPEQLHGSKSRDQNSTPAQDDNLHLYRRIQQQVNHQPRRALSTAATMLKLLRKA